MSRFIFLCLLCILIIIKAQEITLEYESETKPDIYTGSQLDLTCDFSWSSESTVSPQFLGIISNASLTQVYYECGYTNTRDGFIWNLIPGVYSTNPFIDGSKDSACDITGDQPESFKISVEAITKVDWRCWFRAGDGTEYESIPFNMPDLKVAPTSLDMVIDPMEITVGDVVTVTCNSDGTPVAEFEYMLDEATFVGSVYEFTAAKSDDQMEVSCRNLQHLHIKDKTLTKTSKKLAVFYLEVPMELVEESFSMRSREKTLECLVESNANITYKWSSDGVEIVGATTKDLTILPSNETDPIMYMCMVSSASPALERSMTFNIMWTNETTTTMSTTTKKVEQSTPTKDESAGTTPEPKKDYTAVYVVVPIVIIIIIIVIVVIIVLKKRSQASGSAEIKPKEKTADPEAGKGEATEMEKQPLVTGESPKDDNPSPESDEPKPEEPEAPKPATE